MITGPGGIDLGGVRGANLGQCIPMIDRSVDIVGVPVDSDMPTHAVGRPFLMDFEASGTALGLDPKSLRAYFDQEYDKAQDIVREMERLPTLAVGLVPSIAIASGVFIFGIRLVSAMLMYMRPRPRD